MRFELRAIIIAAITAVVLPAHAQRTNTPATDSLRAAAEALALHPDSVPLRLRKAAWNVALDQWDYALDEYSRVLRSDPANLTALYYRAFVNTEMHRYDFARSDYESLLRLMPSNFGAQVGLALLNSRDHRRREAMDQINIIVDQHPDSALAWGTRAGMEAEDGHYELAEYDYTEALLRAPGNRDYLLARADARIRLGRAADARRDLEALVAQGTPRMALKDWFARVRKLEKSR